jgi:hypothetical protein
MLDVLNVSLKNIKDVDKLLKLRNDIKDTIIELKKNDDFNDTNENDIKLLKNRYYNISNKINYINNKDTIKTRNIEKGREYVKNNYEVIKQKNKEYQVKRRLKFKELEEFYNNTNK